MLYKNCLVDLYPRDGMPSFKETGYEVRISRNELVVSYECDDGWVNYCGKDLGGGHYELRSAKVGGRSVLHRTPGSVYLEGYWVENGNSGFWRIQLIR